MTMTVSPQPALTSTSTGYASIPLTAAEHTLANIRIIALQALLSSNHPSSAIPVFAQGTEHDLLEIRDSGSGFDPEKTLGQPGIGLASMQERARLVGGQLTVQSQVGAGTTISLRIPLLEGPQ